MPLVIPNFHVALIHFPIALLLIGVAIEAACSFAWRDSGVRAAGRWMILFAALLGWPAVYSGAYAIRTAAGDDFSSSTWADMRANSPKLSDAATWETLRTHIVINASVVAVTSVVVVAWLMAGSRTRAKLHVPALALLLLASAATGFGAWQGGELVYWHDVTHVKESPGPDAHALREVSLEPQAIVPPLDAHVTLAGFASGLALLAWGVAARTRRAAARLDPVTGTPMAAGETIAAAPSTLADPQRDRIFAAFQPADVEFIATAPPSTLGTLAALAFIVTAGFGLWSLADNFGTWSPLALWTAIVDRGGEPIVITRRFAHLIVGVLAIALTATLGLVGAKSEKRRAWPAIVGGLVLCAVIAQAWLGVLLLLDSNSGSVVGFNH